MSHVWSSNFEHDGMGNVVFTRCVEHINARPLITYDWPDEAALAEHTKAHEEELKALEEIHHGSTGQGTEQEGATTAVQEAGPET